jgi:hypothetical protein
MLKRADPLIGQPELDLSVFQGFKLSHLQLKF